ncbi:hypothetical protein GOBAR_DD11743 [Gossypium barbadense]|nr:hypothetical protein GOBAR_DD11743 [Gossypium barbadense]
MSIFIFSNKKLTRSQKGFNKRETQKLDEAKKKVICLILPWKKADEHVLRLVEEQKIEKGEALKKILLLEKNLKCKLQKKIEEMNNELQEKIDDLQDLESTNKALIYKERQRNDKLHEAKKVFPELLGNPKIQATTLSIYNAVVTALKELFCSNLL